MYYGFALGLNMSIITRILVQHMSEEKDMVTWHIPLTFLKEISHKSEVVSIN